MKYLKSSINVFHYFYGWVGGWPGGVSENGNKAISASIEVKVELSWGWAWQQKMKMSRLSKKNELVMAIFASQVKEIYQFHHIFTSRNPTRVLRFRPDFVFIWLRGGIIFIYRGKNNQSSKSRRVCLPGATTLLYLSADCGFGRPIQWSYTVVGKSFWF